MSAPIKLSAPVNVDMKWSVKLSGPAGSAWPYTAADGLRCDVYSGDGTAVLFSPSVAWGDAAAGRVDLTVAAAQTAALDLGEYPLQGLILPDATALRIPWPAGTLTLTPSPGTTALSPVYTTYERMIELAPWVALCFDPKVHQAGFRRERATARKVVDNLIVRLYRNASVGAFNSLTVAATSWAGGGNRRTMLPSAVIQGYLDANRLIVDDQMDRINAWLAVAEVGRQQAGVNNQLARNGQAAADFAASEISVCTALISVNGDGVPTLPIPLGTSNPFFT